MSTKTSQSSLPSVGEAKVQSCLMSRLTRILAVVLVNLLTMAYNLLTWPSSQQTARTPAITDDCTVVLARPGVDAATGKPDFASPWRSVKTQRTGRLVDNLYPDDCHNLADYFKRAVRTWPNKKSFGTRRMVSIENTIDATGRKLTRLHQAEYQWLSYREAERRVDAITRAMLHVSRLQPRQERVLFFAETRVEWQLCLQAALRAVLPVVTLYATLGEEALLHGLEESEVRIVFTSDELLGKLLRLLPRMPAVREVVYMRDPARDFVPGDDFVLPKSADGLKVYSLQEYEQLGLDQGSEDTNNLPVQATREDLAVIMYTSGSTGAPKGVEIMHGNAMAMLAGIQDHFKDQIKNDDRFFAYLPLAHSFELNLELYLVAAGLTVGYGTPLTFLDSSPKVKRGTRGDLCELKPTVLTCVPTIMNRLHQAVMNDVSKSGAFFSAIFNYAMRTRRNQIQQGHPSPILDQFIFKRVKRLIGGQVRFLISGGAPLGEATQDFMNCCLARVVQGYGLTETSAAGTVCSTNNLRTGHVGAPISSVEIRLRPWVEGGYSFNDQPFPRGEVLIGGPSITRGYYKNEEKTREDFFVDNRGQRWFCTGDIGMFHQDGTLSIIDRKKDLVKLQMGEYVSLGKVEMALLNSPLVEQVCAYGDALETNVVALLVPTRPKLLEMAKQVFTASQDERGCQLFARVTKGESIATVFGQNDNYKYVCQHPKINSAVLKVIQETGREMKLERFEIPTAVFIDSAVWTTENGLLTDALKIKRQAIRVAYQREIDELYHRVH